LLVFSDHVLFPHYAVVPRPFGGNALDDQVAAGVLMWVPGSLAFLVPALLLSVRWLSPPAPSVTRPPAVRQPLRLLPAPVLGPLLRARHGRRLLQGLCLLVALAVVLDGLRGPSAAPMNLAGVVPWTWWRGLTVLALLAAGNFFCLACPFMLPRELAR